VELIFIPTCFRILVINIQQAVSAPCGLKALGNFNISKKEPRNSVQKIILSPCPCGLCPYNCPLPHFYIQQWNPWRISTCFSSRSLACSPSKFRLQPQGSESLSQKPVRWKISWTSSSQFVHSHPSCLKIYFNIIILTAHIFPKYPPSFLYCDQNVFTYNILRCVLHFLSISPSLFSS